MYAEIDQNMPGSDIQSKYVYENHLFHYKEMQLKDCQVKVHSTHGPSGDQKYTHFS